MQGAPILASSIFRALQDSLVIAPFGAKDRVLPRRYSNFARFASFV